MPIHPRPMAETARPLRPSLRVFMMATPEGKLEKLHSHRCQPFAEDSRVGRTLLSAAFDLDVSPKTKTTAAKSKTKAADKSVRPHDYLRANCMDCPKR